MQEVLREVEVVGGTLLPDGGACVELESFSSGTGKKDAARAVRSVWMCGAEVALCETCITRSYSPSRTRCASLHQARDNGKQQHWVVTGPAPGERTVAEVGTVHGAVRLGLGAVAWAPDESRFAYVADEGEEAEEEEDAAFAWSGEGLGEGFGKRVPRIYVVNLGAESPESSVVPLEVQLSGGEAEAVVFASCPALAGDGACFAVLTELDASQPSGVLHCRNRATRVVRVESDGTTVELAAGVGQCQLQYVAHWETLVWLESESRHLHASPQWLYGLGVKGSRALRYLDRAVCDAVVRADGEDALVVEHVVLMQRRVERVSLATGAVEEVACAVAPKSLCSWRVLDAWRGRVLAARSSHVEGVAVEELGVGVVCAPRMHAGRASLTEELVSSEGLHYHVVRPRNVMVPLCVYLHGGPHSAVDTGVDRERSAIALHGGLAVMTVNYVGSLSRPECEALAGGIGDMDVHECYHAVSLELLRHSYTGVTLYGGSHGGFLGAHLSCMELPTLHAVVLRNPVIQLELMLGTTDIPEWCVVEAQGTEAVGTDLERLRACSPLVRLAGCETLPAWTLLGLGGGDRRVPWSQGKNWYYALKGRGASVRVLAYEDEGHSLRSVPYSRLHWLQHSVEFMKEHAV